MKKLVIVLLVLLLLLGAVFACEKTRAAALLLPALVHASCNKRQGMSDEEIFASAMGFAAAARTEDLCITMRIGEALVQKKMDWTAALVEEYPNQAVYVVGHDAYLCNKKAYHDLLDTGPDAIDRTEGIEKLEDFSLAPYMELADSLLRLVQQPLSQATISDMRFNEDPHGEDYLYYDLRADTVMAATELTGETYRSGFVYFNYLGGRASSMGLYLYDAEEGCDTFTFADPAFGGYTTHRGSW